jgi:LPS export ABC transporter protein LptC
MTRQTLQIIVFAVLAILSFGIWKYFFDVPEVEPIKPFTKGYSVKNVELKIIDETGKITAKFKSPDLIKYTDSPIVLINTPLFWTYDNGEEHWVMKSDKAEYNADLAEVNLIGNFVGRLVEGAPFTIIKANNLLVNIDTKQAFTNDGIVFRQRQITMKGQNAHFDLKNEILEVNKDVRAVYAAKKNGK